MTDEPQIYVPETREVKCILVQLSYDIDNFATNEGVIGVHLLELQKQTGVLTKPDLSDTNGNLRLHQWEFSEDGDFAFALTFMKSLMLLDLRGPVMFELLTQSRDLGTEDERFASELIISAEAHREQAAMLQDVYDQLTADTNDDEQTKRGASETD